MKIAIASDDGKNIASHFGRTRGFIIYDVENFQIKNKQYLENTFTGHVRGLSEEEHHADRHGAILSALRGCQAVISCGMGQRIYSELRANGMEAFIVNETDAEQAINLYLRNALQDNPGKGCDH